jgi:hypothetical protein
VQAGGRDLLTAEVVIEPVGTPSAELFDLPVNPAEPGMTLRPIHRDEVRGLLSDSQGSSIQNPPKYLTIGRVITRKGEIREMEVLDTPEPADGKRLVFPPSTFGSCLATMET